MTTEDYLAKPIYRMVHIDNVEYVLQNGMSTCTHAIANSDYINIGDLPLISQRNDFSVRIIPPGGVLGEYVPFYFAGHSPMLLNIKTGWRGVTKRNQAEIVFIVSTIERIIRHCPDWCFTDGHAKNNISKFYNEIECMDRLDWSAIQLQYWNNTIDDMDRQRRKEAEFLVKNFIPNICVQEIYVYNEARRFEVQNMVERLNLEIAVNVDNDNKLYFP